MNLEDQLYKYLRYYQKLPPPLMKVIGNIYSRIPLTVRYGSIFKKYYELISTSQYWSDSKKKQYILTNINDTIKNAYFNTEYYNRILKNINIGQEGIKNISVFETIPFSDKVIIRNNKQELLSKKYNKNDLLYTTTGGTSGIPIELYLIKGVERSRELAFMMRQWERIGFKYNDKIIVLRGGVVNNKDGNIWYKYEPIKNRLLLSNYDLTEQNVSKYVEKIIEYKPAFIHTYPSAISIIAKYLSANKIAIKGLRGILCSSEQFYPGQRKLIEDSFQTRVYSWYGHSEAGTLAGECEHSQEYHIFYEYGYTELIDEMGNVIDKPNIQGEIVTTSFEMRAFPIIRYRTGDYAEYSNHKCKCGRNYTLIKNVQGRWKQEYILAKNGVKISLTSLNMHSDIFNNVHQYQYCQYEKGKVILRIVPQKKYSEKDTDKIKNELVEKIRNNVDLQIEMVDSIEKTKAGKHKFLISNIKNEL